MNGKILLAAAIVALLLAVGFYLLSGDRKNMPEEEPAVAVPRQSLQEKTVVRHQAGQRAQKKRVARLRREKPELSFANEAEDDSESGRTPEERKLMEDIENALADENFELAKKCAPLALASPDVEIRRSMVETLGWFGSKALPELTPFIADTDGGIAEDAMNEWENAISSIDNDEKRIAVVEMALQVIADEDALESISDEYIGVDEKLAVESLLRVIEAAGNPRGITKAKETYEFITGDEFISRQAAEKWIAEEYEPAE